MKTLLLAVLVGLLTLTAYVVGTIPRPALNGRTPLYWATDDNPLRKEQTGLFNQLHPDLQIAVDPSNYAKDKIIVQSKAGVGPDVWDYWGEADFNAYVQSGMALDLTDILRERGINFQEAVWPLAKPWTVTREGRVYGVPANVGVDAFWFHKDLFEAAGVPFPKDGWKLDDLIATAEKLTIREPNGRTKQYGLLVDFNGTYAMFLASFGGTMWDETGTRCLLDSPQSLACLQFVHDLLYKYRVSPTPTDEQSITSGGGWGGGAGSQAYFRRKVGAMAIGGRWWLAQLRGDIKDRGFDLGAVPPPVARYNRFSAGGTRATMVNARSPHRDAAVEFVVFLLQEPYNLLLNDQADALSGVRKYAYDGRYENNPRDPGADFHVAFRKTLERGVPMASTPFLPRSEVDLYFNRQLDLVKLNQKRPEQGLKDAVRDIQAAMDRWVSRNPELQEAYDAAKARAEARS